MTKKLLVMTLPVVLALSLSANAQETFGFVDRTGMVIPSGSTVDVTDVVHEVDYGTGEEYDVMYSGLAIANVAGAPASLRVVLTIDQMDNGQFQFCFPMSCQYYEAVGTYTTASDQLGSGETRDLLAEWFPMAAGRCDVTMQVQIMQRRGSFPNYSYTYVGDGPSVKLRFGNNVPLTLRGDVNGDNVVDVTDVSDLIDVVLGKIAPEDLPGDCHVAGNEVVDVTDVTTLIDIVLGK